jgi:hypothetical protein
VSAVHPGHERVEELIAIDVAGGLDTPDRAELDAVLAEHGPDGPACRALFAAYREAAAILAIGLEPVALPDGAEDRLVAAAHRRDAAAPGGNGADRPRGSAVPAADGGIAPAGPRARTRSGGRWVIVVAVGGTLIIGLVAGFVAAPKAPQGTTGFLGFAARPGTGFAAFPTADGQHLSVAYRPGGSAAWIFGSGLTKPAGGRTYELWWGSPGSPLARMTAAGVFVPIHGDVIAPMTIGSSAPGTVLVVTVEPPGGSPRPTTKPIFVTSV